jgi:thioredoxin reductase (NADPH)
MAIGHKPNSDIFLPWVDVDSHGYIKTTSHTATKTPGVFAAGDIADPTFKQAITAAGMGCQAAIQAQRFLEEHEEH